MGKRLTAPLRTGIVGGWAIANDRKLPFPDRQAGYPAAANLLDTSIIHGQQQDVLGQVTCASTFSQSRTTPHRFSRIALSSF